MSQEASCHSLEESLAPNYTLGGPNDVDQSPTTNNEPNSSGVVPTPTAEFTEATSALKEDKTPSRVSESPPAVLSAEKELSFDGTRYEDQAPLGHVHVVQEPVSDLAELPLPSKDSISEAQVSLEPNLEETHQADLEHNLELLRDYQGSDTAHDEDVHIVPEAAVPSSTQPVGNDGTRTTSKEAGNAEDRRPVMFSQRFLKKKKDQTSHWNSGITQEAASRFHARQAERAAAPATDLPHEELKESQDPLDVSWMVHSVEKAEDHELAEQEFKESKKAYQRKVRTGTNKEADDIEYARLEHGEQSRLRRLQAKRAYDQYEEQQAADEQQENAMFYSDEEDSLSQLPGYIPAFKTPPKKKVMMRRPPTTQFDNNSELELVDARKKQSVKKSHKSAAKKNTSGKVTKSSSAKATKSSSAKAGRNSDTTERTGRKKRPQMSNVKSVFSNNILADAQANEGLEAQPAFGDAKGRKDQALKQLIASVTKSAPTKEESQIARQDKNAIMEAIKHFSSSRAIQPNPEKASWHIKGMKSSLEHYQLLGAGWMRERETCGTRPHGGLQADIMGTGKTVMTLANIVDGRPAKGDRCKSTLIVVPSHLQSQWMSEIRQHVDPQALPRVMVYAAKKFNHLNAVADLESQNVVLTSYHQVAASYPTVKIPLELTTDEAKNRWWQKTYAKERGDLHRVYWYRIVLDECHIIKNHEGKISIAVRALSGRYRWALSGTPCTNHPGELYPLLNFLRVENTGSYELFMRNYGKTSSEATVKRLHILLSQIMIRRTHADRLFNLPLVKLPKISKKTVTLKFNKTERAIYNIVKTRFVERINNIQRNGSVVQKAHNIYVLMLRLRMIVSHVLLIQSTLEQLLETEDLEKLWELSDDEMRSDSGLTGRAMWKELREQIAGAQEIRYNANRATKSLSESRPSTENLDIDNDTGKEFGVAFNFRAMLTQMRESGRWEERNLASLCRRCATPPEHPRVLDPCGHLYCNECLSWMMYQVTKQEQETATCFECNLPFSRAEPLHGFKEAGRGILTTPTSSQPSGQKALDPGSTAWINLGKEVLYSAKTLAAKGQILNWLSETPDAKILIFTQFLGMVAIFNRICRTENWGSVTFTGTQSFENRDRALARFAEDPDCKIMIASLRSGGSGLNLCCASRILLLDLWFNEAAENQAFTRCWRIGQTRDVEVVRFVVEKTIDYDMMKMQERKTTMIEKALDKEGLNRRWSTKEIIELFGAGAGSTDPDAIEEEFTFVDEPSDGDSDMDGQTNFRLPARPK